MDLTDEKQNEDGRNKNFWRPRKRFAAILYREHTRRHSNMKNELIDEKPLTKSDESSDDLWSRNVYYIFYFDADFNSFAAVMKLFDDGNNIGHFLRRILWET